MRGRRLGRDAVAASAGWHGRRRGFARRLDARAAAAASSLPEEERYARLKQWVGELPTDERLAFFKLITGELRVGVSRLQVVKALAEVAGVDEGHMAQRLIGYSQARRIPTAADFEALIGEVLHAEAHALDAGKTLSCFISRNRGAGRSPTWARPSAALELIIEWKYDGIRAQLLKRGENWRLWSRGEELISDAYPDLEPLARALPSGTAIDGELVVLIPPEHDFATDSLDGPRDLREPAAEARPQDRQRKDEARIAGRLHRLRSARERGSRPSHRAAACATRSARTACRSPVRRSEGARRAPAVSASADGFRRHMGGASREARAGAGAFARGVDAEGARRRLWESGAARATIAPTCGGNGSSTR